MTEYDPDDGSDPPFCPVCGEVDCTCKEEAKMKWNSIGKEKAIKLFDSKWWEGLDAKQVAKFQIATDELCMPFGDFHAAVEKALGRSVWTHEFGLNRDGLWLELIGEKDAPTMDEIMNLIPEEKRIVIQL